MRRQGSQSRAGKARRDFPPRRHPLVRTHPVTGKKGLFVTAGFTSRICELSPEESDTLLTFLFKHSTQPKYFVRWHWQNGDVAVWDNRCTQHLASFDYGDFHRIMHRATVMGINLFNRLYRMRLSVTGG